jgi:hypothetical protein
LLLRQEGLVGFTPASLSFLVKVLSQTVVGFLLTRVRRVVPEQCLSKALSQLCGALQLLKASVAVLGAGLSWLLCALLGILKLFSRRVPFI